MGKKSKYPNYSSGNIVVNGNTVASTSKNDGSINSSYNMSDTEKNIYNSIQNNLETSLGNLFEISDEKQQMWNNQLDAYKQEGINQINSIYTPMETALKNDIASRFGNFDNSIFMDNLSNITDNKAQAVADLSDSLLMKQDELYANEMANRINYITLLSNLNTIMNNNILSYMQAAQSNAESGNNYNANAYNAQNSGGSLLSGLADIGTTALSFYNPIAGAASKLGTSAIKSSYTNNGKKKIKKIK